MRVSDGTAKWVLKHLLGGLFACYLCHWVSRKYFTVAAGEEYLPSELVNVFTQNEENNFNMKGFEK